MERPLKSLGRRRFLAQLLAMLGFPSAVPEIVRSSTGWVVTGGTSRALASKPLIPVRHEEFYLKYYFPDSPSTQEVARQVPADDPQKIRSELVHFSERRFPDSLELRERMLAAFEDPRLDGSEGIGVHAALRAAMAALVGTFAEPSLHAMLQAIEGKEQSPLEAGFKLTKIAFAEPIPWDPESIGRVNFHNSTGECQILINNVCTDDWRALISTMAHETCHVDRTNSIEEELGAILMQTLTYISILQDIPELATSGCLATRIDNILVLALLNSGPRNHFGVGPASTNIFPTTPSELKSWEEMVFSWAYQQPPENRIGEGVEIVCGLGTSAFQLEPGSRADNPIGPKNPVRQMLRNLWSDERLAVADSAQIWTDPELRRHFYDLPLDGPISGFHLDRAAEILGLEF